MNNKVVVFFRILIPWILLLLLIFAHEQFSKKYNRKLYEITILLDKYDNVKHLLHDLQNLNNISYINKIDVSESVSEVEKSLIQYKLTDTEYTEVKQVFNAFKFDPVIEDNMLVYIKVGNVIEDTLLTIEDKNNELHIMYSSILTLNNTRIKVFYFILSTVILLQLLYQYFFIYKQLFKVIEKYSKYNDSVSFKGLLKKLNETFNEKENEFYDFVDKIKEFNDIAQLGSWYWMEGRITLSDEIKKLCGISNDFITLKDLTKKIEKHSKRIFLRDLFYQLKSHKNKLNIDLKLNNDLWINIKATIKYTKDKKIERIYGVVQNITNRVVKEIKIEELALAVEQSFESVVITDIEGNIIYVNESFVMTSGYGKDELIGHNTNILKSGQTSNGTYVELWDTITEGRVWKGVLYNKKKTGELYTELVTISPLRRTDGKIYRYVGVKENITQKLEISKELQQYKGNLERLVDEKTLLLKEALNRAEELGKAKETFLANISHEIRTPMNAILGMLYLLKKTNITKEQLSYIEKIELSGNLLVNIINDVLDISKIDSDKLVLHRKNIKPYKIVNNVYQILKNSAKEKSLEFELDNQIPEIEVLCDDLRVTQVLLNITKNAIKFTENGRVTIIAKSVIENGSVRLFFEIKDTGVGIPDNKISSIFNKFEQVDNSITRSVQGTGLGLAISKSIISSMGGDIQVESTPGVGSCFLFNINCLLSKEGTLNDDNIQKSISKDFDILKNAKVLAVDDDEINRSVLQDILKDYLVEVTIEINGEKAVERVSDTNYDLILMDMQMPVMDGISATKKIRESKLFIPIIALTGNAFEENKKECFTAGMNDFLSKPIQVDELLKEIKKWLFIQKQYSEYFDIEYINKTFKNKSKSFLKLCNSFFIRYEGISGDNITKEFVHKLKGASSTLGFIKIRDFCKNYNSNYSRGDDLKKIISDTWNLLKIIEEYFEYS